jgi:hypothetical protein
MFIRACALATTAWLAAAPAAAQPPSQSGSPSVPVVVTSGEGTVKKAPDRAWVTIAAESRARTAPEAQRANSEAMTAVTGKIKAAGIPPEAMQTSGFTLQPEFDFASGRQTLRDYVARNQLQVRVDNLPKLGEIIDAAVSVGATNVSGVRFDLQDRDSAEREALKQAVADAKARADALAAGAGLKVDHVVRIEEQRDVAGPRPMPMYAAARSEGMNASVPIESGEIEVRAHVTLTAAIR